MSALLFSFLLTVSSFAPAVNDTIFWREETRLNWSDFRGMPDPKDPAAAVTAWNLNYRYEYSFPSPDKPLTVRFSVVCYFDRKRSWAKPDQRTETILRHEQGHFDIAELHARILRQEFTGFHPENVKKLSNGAEKIFRHVSSDCREMQEDYDSATRHSRNPDRQSRWEETIRKRLGELESYRSTGIINGTGTLYSLFVQTIP